jgi:hypothetical protein
VPFSSTISAALFFTSGDFLKRPNRVALRFRSPVLRVWLPSRRSQLAHIPRASFSSRHSWASPFRALLLFGDRKESFPSLLPLLPFSTKPSRLGAEAPAVWTHRKSRAPSCFPNGLGRGGACCSLGPCDLSGFSLRRYPRGRIYRLLAPLVLSPCRPHDR